MKTTEYYEAMKITLPTQRGSPKGIRGAEKARGGSPVPETNATEVNNYRAKLSPIVNMYSHLQSIVQKTGSLGNFLGTTLSDRDTRPSSVFTLIGMLKNPSWLTFASSISIATSAITEAKR